MDREPHETHGRATHTTPVTYAPITDAAAARGALAALDDAQASLGVPLVDEVEYHRLQAAADDVWPASWTALLALRGDEPVGYGAAHRATNEDGEVSVTGDLAAFAGVDRWTGVLPGLARTVHRAASETFTADTPDGRLVAWVRHIDLEALATVRAAGFALDRHLGVLGRTLTDAPGAAGEATAARAKPTAHEVTVRAVEPGADDAEVAALLAAAYAGTGDGGWDVDRLRERYALPWFLAQDLLLAVDPDGSVAALLWLKRRDPTTGEIYNLAVHPQAQGRGLGPFLLTTGLEHLRAVGCTDVLLWVDLANARAADIYRSEGFTTRWEDVALGRDLADRG